MKGQSRRGFMLTAAAYNLLLTGCILVITGCNGSAHAQSDGQTSTGWGGAGGAGQVSGAVATLVVPEMNGTQWGNSNGAQWPGKDGNWASNQLSTPEWGNGQQGARVYEAIPPAVTPSAPNLIQGFVELAGSDPTVQPLPPQAEVIVLQPTMVVQPTDVPQLQVQAFPLQPVAQQPVEGNQNCTCVSQYAISVGNPNNTRQCYVMLPGDESQCTPNGWVYVGPQR